MSAHQPAGSHAIRVGACLSLTGRHARFGTQAARGLEAWRKLDGAAALIIEDDESSPHRVERVLPRVAGRCDVLLGPYSTQLMRTEPTCSCGITAVPGMTLRAHIRATSSLC